MSLYIYNNRQKLSLHSGMVRKPSQENGQRCHQYLTMTARFVLVILMELILLLSVCRPVCVYIRTYVSVTVCMSLCMCVTMVDIIAAANNPKPILYKKIEKAKDTAWHYLSIMQ